MKKQETKNEIGERPKDDVLRLRTKHVICPGHHGNGVPYLAFVSIRTGKLVQGGDDLNEPSVHFVGLRHAYMMKSREDAKPSYEQEMKRLRSCSSVDELNTVFSSVYDYLVDYERDDHVTENTVDMYYSDVSKRRLVYIARNIISHLFQSEGYESVVATTLKNITGMETVFAEVQNDEHDDRPSDVDIRSEASINFAKCLEAHMAVACMPYMINVRNLILYAIDVASHFRGIGTISFGALTRQMETMQFEGVIYYSSTDKCHPLYLSHPRNLKRKELPTIAAIPDLRYSHVGFDIDEPTYIKGSRTITCDGPRIEDSRLKYEVPIPTVAGRLCFSDYGRFPSVDRGCKTMMLTCSDVVVITSLIKLFQMMVLSHNHNMWVGSFFPVVSGLDGNSYKNLFGFGRYCARVMYGYVNFRKLSIPLMKGTDTRSFALFKHLYTHFITPSVPRKDMDYHDMLLLDRVVQWNVPSVYSSLVPAGVSVIPDMQQLMPDDFPKII